MKRTTSVIVTFAATAIAASPALAQDCVWRPWAAAWSNINEGPDLYPNNGVFDPTNWDYSFSQTTRLNTPKTTPDGSPMAFHWFLDSQLPSQPSDGSGSGGVYQEITVTPDVPLKYSFWWRGASGSNTTWFEFMLIDGPFTLLDADKWDPSNTNPHIMRKRENATFVWEKLTDTSTSYPGPVRSTMTPTGTTVTVVLKAGRAPEGAMEAFFDDVRVWQGDDDRNNLVVNGDFEDTAAQSICDEQLMFQDPTHDNYWYPLSQCLGPQHTTAAPVDPTSHPNDSDATVTITGTDLDLVTQVRLVPVSGGTDLVGTNPVVNETKTTLTADFRTTGATDGLYNVVTVQSPAPPCLMQTLPAAFEITCPTAMTVTGVSPAEVVDPGFGESLTVSGTNLDRATDASLIYRVKSSPVPVYNDPSVSMAGDDLIAGFDLTCAPAGSYDLVLNRSDACRDKTVSQALRVSKSLPSGGCLWQPWAADWTQPNLTPDLDPGEAEAFDATNWDYTFSQHPDPETTLDTPDGSALALHWFLDVQTGYNGSGTGSGGVFQQITVQPGVPLEYSYYWKGASTGNPSSWFELILLDGPFSMQYADQFQENTSANNPYMIRKRELGTGAFAWEQVTHLTPADTGPAGRRPQTLTPTGTVVTVILKAGTHAGGAMESLWDNVIVTQNGGSNLINNGNFENGGQAGICDQETVFQDECEFDSWRRSTFVPLECLNWDPFADADQDGDVDQADFAALQVCYTGGAGPFTLPAECACFDRPESIEPDGDIDQADLFKFEDCASGPGVPANPACDD